MSKRSETRPIYKKVLTLGTILFKTIPLCSDTALPAPLPLLERVWKSCSPKCVKHLLRFVVSKQRPFSCNFIYEKKKNRKENHPSRAGAIGSPCCYSQETRVLQELGERVHCHHEASNCLHATVQAVSAECPASDASEHCSRTCC